VKLALKVFVTLLLVGTGLLVQAHAEPKVTYVGLGRYSCSGSTAECAQIDQNNRRESEYRARQYQREQDRAQESVERTRRENEERRDLKRRDAR
jgi:hypothetical protein